MPNVLEVAASGMRASEGHVANTAHSLANSTTTGFKSSLLVTQTVMPQTLKQAGATSSSTGTIANVGTYLGGGSRIAGTVPILTQGDLINTGQDTHVAILGNGYLQIEMPDGTLSYTRDGTFNRGSDGTLETIDGYKVVPGITIPENATAVMISKTGQVEARISGQVADQVLGQIQLAIFSNPAGLEPLNGNYLGETQASGAALVGNPGDKGFGQLHQRALESSNVDAVTEVINLIKSQRAYEMSSKAITVYDEMQALLRGLAT